MQNPGDNISCRIVFLGTPDFAVESLKKLIESKHQVVGVITAPDRQAGRGQKLRLSPVKIEANKFNIPVLQPEKFKNSAFLEELRSLNADLFVVVAFRMLPEQVWNMPPMGTFNLHASLLPQYRGAAPINWALINGEKETGITTFFLNHQIDTGNILLQEKIAIHENMTAGELHDILMETGSALTIKTVNAIVNQTIIPEPQSLSAYEKEIKPAPKIFKEDCKIQWSQPASLIHNLIRGLSPYPAAWTRFFDQNDNTFQIKIFRSEIHDSSPELDPGQVLIMHNGYLLVGTTSKTIRLLRIQPEGKRQMEVKDFLRGYRGQILKVE
ncbi:MAG: methionyl-tRNA formyltransferase [Bacteroidota bacterium]|nr:methionyl-tRNA formyltransferase [Bacteroidota bacterium]